MLVQWWKIELAKKIKNVKYFSWSRNLSNIKKNKKQKQEITVDNSITLKRERRYHLWWIPENTWRDITASSIMCAIGSLKKEKKELVWRKKSQGERERKRKRKRKVTCPTFLTLSTPWCICKRCICTFVTWSHSKTVCIMTNITRFTSCGSTWFSKKNWLLIVWIVWRIINCF